MKNNLVLAALVVLAAPVYAQSTLYIARPEIALSVSDKFAPSQPRVEFTVTMPNGKTTSATAAAVGGGERAGTVHYPGDFGNAGTQLGEYKWTAAIGGKQVLSGSFAYRPSKDGQVLYVPR